MPEWGPGAGAGDVKDGTSDGSSGSDGVSWWSLSGIPTPLEKFAVAPAGFIVGALLDTLLGGVETMLTALIDAVVFLFEGSSVGSLEGSWGIADIPRYGATMLGDVLQGVGTSLIVAVGNLFMTLQTAAGAAGPAAPLLAGVTIAAVIVAGGYAVQFLWTLAVDTLNPL